MKELELGKRYTWEEVKETYPGMWVRMSDCTLTIGAGIIDGILVGVYSDEESEEVELSMWDEDSKDEFRRTSLGMNIGVIECLNAKMEVRDMKELELGKRYTWQKVKETYPGMWVRMSDCTLGYGKSIVDGILVGVYSDEESEEVELSMMRECSKDKLRRTSLGMNIGVIECLNATMEVRDTDES